MVSPCAYGKWWAKDAEVELFVDVSDGAGKGLREIHEESINDISIDIKEVGVVLIRVRLEAKKEHLMPSEDQVASIVYNDAKVLMENVVDTQSAIVHHDSRFEITLTEVIFLTTQM